MCNLKKLVCFIFLIATDIASLLASFLMAYLFRSHVLPQVFSAFKKPPLPLETQLNYGFFYGALIVVFVFSFEKLYTRRFSFWDEIKHLYRGLIFSFTLLMILVFISRRYEQFSRAVIIASLLFSLIFFPSFRLLVKKILVKLNFWKKKVLILGSNETARLVAHSIKINPTLGYEIIGFLTNERKKIGNIIFDDIKVIGEIDQIEDLGKDLKALDIIIAIPDLDHQKLIELVEKSEKLAETIRVVPNIGSIFTIGVEVENLGDVLSLSLARNLVKPWNIYAKRIFELFLTAALSVFFLPFFIIAALAIKIDSRGPVIFIQERLAADGKKFKLFKFRSMYGDGDSKLDEYFKKNASAKKEWQKYQKLKKYDPRVTLVGKFLRKYSLDEIPQLINVLKGDMALVGPRPYLPRERKNIGKSYQIISRVKPGITGLWQVRGRNILPFKERLLLDEYYIRNWSLWLDMVILIKTVKVFITREGAY